MRQHNTALTLLIMVGCLGLACSFAQAQSRRNNGYQLPEDDQTAAADSSVTRSADEDMANSDDWSLTEEPTLSPRHATRSAVSALRSEDRYASAPRQRAGSAQDVSRNRQVAYTAQRSNPRANPRGQKVSRTAYEYEEGGQWDAMASPDSTCGGCGDCGECGSCDDDCGLCMSAYCGPRFIWARAEYLAWWKKGMDTPPLVTTNPTTTPSLNNATTVVLFGDESLNKDATSGGRFTLGTWLDQYHLHGIDFTYMTLGTESTSYRATSDDYARLGRPFFDVEAGAAAAHLISYPAPGYTGWVNVTAETSFQGCEMIYRRAVKNEPVPKADFLIGWRWLQLKDDLLIDESATLSGVGTIALQDRFNTKNDFNGIEFGVQWERKLSRRWTVEMLGKMGLGCNRSVVTISGHQTGDIDQGLLALDSNSGTHADDRFATMGEIGVTLKRRFVTGWELTCGYSLLYWSDVMRAGDQIDLNVDPRQIPPTPTAQTHPELLMRSTSFWAQGFHVGLEYAF